MVIAVATRFFESKAANMLPALDRLGNWVEGALTVASSPELVCVAVNVDADTSGSISFLKERYPQVTVIPVTPWGKFVMPLNALVLAAATKGADRILFTSAEFPAQKSIVEKLAAVLDSGRHLVAGARLDGHEFCMPEGKQEYWVRGANGRQIPWNTYALWDLYRLALTGFLLVGDSPYDPPNAGVEELATIALHDYNFVPNAALVSIPEMSSQWDTSGWDADRLAKHATKMASKVQRPAAQLKQLGRPGPTVLHVHVKA